MTEIAVRTPVTLVIADDTDPLTRHVAAWLLGHRSAHTRTAYGRDLRAFLGWCAARDITVITATRGHVDAYARELEEVDGRSVATVARRLSALASFYAYLVAEDVLTRSPLTHVKRPRLGDDSQTTGLDRDEVRALLATAATDSPRAHALIGLLAGNGLRIGEALAADVADLDTERGHRVLRIVRKGGKRATVPLAPSVAAVLDVYLDGRADGPLFTTRTGRRLDEPAVFRLIRRLARDAGIASASKLSPHSLRHSFVTLSLDAGVSLRDVQDAAGHSDPRTTRRYDRARHNLDRHAAYQLAGYLAG
ncbi:tyrosine-type recombinase/integrase [Frankia sp. Cr1]|uniref:tyrosine-type recombinase/integrase n=1 Tax=Frankia sp. Cr1 TaxID=3073931 RepID=UPI002AD54986|nr:tyrosine-type recombinase/integrase [Frankia sp. Cr1]